MAEKSYVDYAYEIVSNDTKPYSFKDLFDAVLKATGDELDDTTLKVKMSKFYTQLSLDGRFTILTDNYWDLRVRYTYDDSHINMDVAYTEEDESDDTGDEEENKLLKEEAGEEVDNSSDNESDDIDFDKPRQSNDSDDEL